MKKRVVLFAITIVAMLSTRGSAQAGGWVERTPDGGIFHSNRKSSLGLYTYDGQLVVGAEMMTEYPVVIQLDSGSVAQRAGLKINDVILSVNGNDARTGSRAFHLRPGETRFVLRIRRGDEEMELLMERAPRHGTAAP